MIKTKMLKDGKPYTYSKSKVREDVWSRLRRLTEKSKRDTHNRYVSELLVAFSSLLEFEDQYAAALLSLSERKGLKSLITNMTKVIDKLIAESSHG